VIRVRKRGSFGLDIGSSAVKAVQIVSGKVGPALKSSAIVALPREAITDGAIKQPQAVVDAIRECAREARIGDDNCAVISLAGRDSIVKRVTLPRVSTKELADAISLEAEHHIPFAIEDVFLDYQVLGESDTTMSVLLVATKKGKVLEHVSLVERAGFEVSIVDLDAFAIQNQHERNRAGDAAVALIDIGASIMKTNVVHGGASIFARDVPFGGNNYTDAIARRLGLSVDRAEAAKCGLDADVSEGDVRPVLADVSRELCREVQRTFDYVASTAEAEPIAKIVLSGGGATLAGLADPLASSCGVTVELARPLATIAHDRARWSEGPRRASEGRLAVAVGLALRRLGDRRA
jgi:type IV pilus assembly protein PilM